MTTTTPHDHMTTTTTVPQRSGGPDVSNERDEE